MFNQINRLFLDNIQNDRVVFYKSDVAVKFEDFMQDVAKYANHFSRNIPETQVVLYIPDNLYLFYVCFMAALQADKDIILPALFKIYAAICYSRAKTNRNK